MDDAALDDLLGSDTEAVSNKLNRSKPRRTATAPTASAKRPSLIAADTSKGDWDDNSDADQSLGSDDDRPPPASRKPLSRPPPSRHRALPTKKPTTSTNSGAAKSMTDDLDSALFGLGGGSSGTARGTLSAPGGEEAAAGQRPRSRSRTLDTRRDDSDRPISAGSGKLEEDEDDWDAPASSSAVKGQAAGKRAENSRVRGRPRSGLSIDNDVRQSLAQAMEQQREEESKQPQESSIPPSSDEANDRRSRYREMMQKRKEERASLSLQADTAPPPVSQISSRPPTDQPAKPSSSQPHPPADDLWSTMDDPLSSIGDQPSAADKIAQSLAAFGSGTQSMKEQPMPMARTQPVSAVVEDSGSLLGGRRPRAMAGRRAAGLSALPASNGAESVDRPTTAPTLPVAAATAPLPTAMKVEVTAADLSSSSTQPRSHASAAPQPATSPFGSVTAAAPSAPSFSMWCQWLGLDTASSAQPLLAIGRRAATQPLPAHITHRDNAWHNIRTGRRTVDHPALGKWRKKVEQKQLAIKYNVDDDDSDEDADSFWRDVDEQQAAEERQQQQAIPAEVAAVLSTSPTLAAMAASPFTSQPPRSASPPASSSFSQHTLPSFMTTAIASTTQPTHSTLPLPPMALFSLPPAAGSGSNLPSAALIEEALAQQRTTLTREFQQQLSDAIAHHIQLNTLTMAQRTKEEEDRRHRDDERHRHEVAALREQLYDSRVMRGLTESIEAGVRGVEELREKASQEKKQREEEREQATKLREELLTQREKAVEQSISHYDDKRKQAEAEARSYQREAEALKQEKAALVSSLQVEREEMRLQRRQLQTEKELLMAEKAKYISESGKWERERAEQHDLVAALREMTERKHRQADEELQRARDDRAAVMAQLDGEREESRVQRELIQMRRRRLEEDERKLQTARDEFGLREAEVAEQVAIVQRLGLQLNRQSAVLVNERRQLDDERRQWDAQEHQLSVRDKRTIEAPYYAHPADDTGIVDISSRGRYTPTVFFAPFLASTRRVDHTRELSAADLKLLECESDSVLDGSDVSWNGEWTQDASVMYQSQQPEVMPRAVA